MSFLHLQRNISFKPIDAGGPKMHYLQNHKKFVIKNHHHSVTIEVEKSFIRTDQDPKPAMIEQVCLPVIQLRHEIPPSSAHPA